MQFFQINAVALASILSFAHAVPILDVEARGNPGDQFCLYKSIYSITNQQTSQGTPERIAGAQTGPDSAGGSLAAGYTYSKAITHTGGVTAEFLITEIFSAGVNPSVSVTYTKGTGISALENCPDDVICGLTAAATLLQVTGTQIVHLCGDPNPVWPCTIDAPATCFASGGPYETEIPFTANLPVTIPDSLVNGQDSMVTTFVACAVGSPTGGLVACPPI